MSEATPFRAACLQVTSERDYAPNLQTVSAMVRAARDQGADLILTPENVSLLEPKNKLLREKARPEADHPALPVFSGLAKETGAWIVIGSLAIQRDDGKLANRSYLIDADGAIAARYDKIHMFDVDLANGEHYRESATFEPGDRAVVADTPWGRIGLTVCYDLRFAYLYRALAKAGAQFITVPAAFTRFTGEAHWHTLLKARAIEHGCFILAPAQCGTHAEGRQTYGHSLMVDPWGRVLADAGPEPGTVIAEIDPARIAEARQMVPAINHDRPFDAP